MPATVLATLAVALQGFLLVATALPFVRTRAWWVRIWDFPRLQLGAIGAVAFVVDVLDGVPARGWRLALLAAALAAMAWQLLLIWRYTRLAPREVQPAASSDEGARLSLVISNVLQTNREADRLLAVLRDADPDVVLCVETDGWWRDRLDALGRTHPHAVRCALDNTYGMLLYSRLPLEDSAIEYLVQDDIPSIRTLVRLRGGQRVLLRCVHPRPPAPGESDESLERDAELLLVGEQVREATLPAVVCGDLNDVAWSRSTRLFQKVSRLVDPRKGRGFFSTFHARWPGLRYPLDHVFHSPDFRLVALRRLPYVGSDHFPVQVVLSHEPPAAVEQEAPAEDADDLREADETVREGRAKA